MFYSKVMLKKKIKPTQKKSLIKLPKFLVFSCKKKEQKKSRSQILIHYDS